MSYLELDDGILNHPKFVLAADRGGSGAIHMWLGLRAYCGQHITDGDIPKYMLKKVSGPERPRDREHALAVLIEVGLIEEHTDHYQLHDFLDHCRSREEILKARARNRERQAKSRGSHSVTDTVTARAVTHVVTVPSPLPSSPLLSPPKESEEHARAPDEQSTWDGSDRETACPLDIAQRAKALGIPEKLAESLKVDRSAVDALIHDFASYWTIGGGMGQKRRHWMRKLRENVRKEAGKPGGLPAPGALEHSNLTRESRITLKEIDQVEQSRLVYEAEKKRRAAANGQ